MAQRKQFSLIEIPDAWILPSTCSATFGGTRTVDRHEAEDEPMRRRRPQGRHSGLRGFGG